MTSDEPEMDRSLPDPSITTGESDLHIILFYALPMVLAFIALGVGMWLTR